MGTPVLSLVPKWLKTAALGIPFLEGLYIILPHMMHLTPWDSYYCHYQFTNYEVSDWPRSCRLSKSYQSTRLLAQIIKHFKGEFGIACI